MVAGKICLFSTVILIVRPSVFFDSVAPALLLLLSFLPPPRLRRLTAAAHQHPPLFVAYLLILPFDLASNIVLLGGVMWDPALQPSTTALAFSSLHMLPTRQESNQNNHESLQVVTIGDITDGTCSKLGLSSSLEFPAAEQKRTEVALAEKAPHDRYEADLPCTLLKPIG